MNHQLGNILIRNARTSDVEDIVELLNRIIEKGDDTVWDMPCTVEFERQWMEDLRPGSLYNVAQRMDDSKIVGIHMLSPMLRYYRATAHNANMWLLIDLDERGKGIGSFLAKATFEEAKNKGYERVYIQLREDNLNSISFAFKLGFRIIGTAENQAKCYSKYLNLVILEKSLL